MKIPSNIIEAIQERLDVACEAGDHHAAAILYLVVCAIRETDYFAKLDKSDLDEIVDFVKEGLPSFKYDLKKYFPDNLEDFPLRVYKEGDDWEYKKHLPVNIESFLEKFSRAEKIRGSLEVSEEYDRAS